MTSLCWFEKTWLISTSSNSLMKCQKLTMFTELKKGHSNNYERKHMDSSFKSFWAIGNNSMSFSQAAVQAYWDVTKKSCVFHLYCLIYFRITKRRYIRKATIRYTFLKRETLPAPLGSFGVGNTYHRAMVMWHWFHHLKLQQAEVSNDLASWVLLLSKRSLMEFSSAKELNTLIMVPIL